MTKLEEINAETTLLRQQFEKDLGMYRTACFCDEKNTADILRETSYQS